MEPFFLRIVNKHLPTDVAMGITGLHINTKLPLVEHYYTCLLHAVTSVKC